MKRSTSTTLQHLTGDRYCNCQLTADFIPLVRDRSIIMRSGEGGWRGSNTMGGGGEQVVFPLQKIVVKKVLAML